MINGLIDDYEVTDVEEGWLVIGANLESEARVAVFEDLVDRLAGSSEFVDEILALSEADAEPGYWEVAEVYTFTIPVEFSRHAQVIPHPVEGCFGWLLRVED